MKMSIIQLLFRIARHAGHQGARCSAGNQADSDKLTTGRTRARTRTKTKPKPSPFLLRFLLCFSISWLIAKVLFFSTQLVFLDMHQHTHLCLLNLVLPVKNFEPNLSFSTFSLYYFHFGKPKHGVSKYTTSLPFSIMLLILLAGDVARNPGPINVCFCNMCSLCKKSAIIQDIVYCHFSRYFRDIRDISIIL